MMAAVDFELHAAVRGSSPSNYMCPDEDPGCPMTRNVLCAFGKDGDTTKEQKLRFMVCWDKTEGSTTSRAQTCAKQTKIDWSKTQDCIAGKDGDDIMLAAAKDFTKRHPGSLGVPHIEINGKAQDDRDYDALLKVLCGTGIKVEACREIVAEDGPALQKGFAETQIVPAAVPAEALFSDDPRVMVV